MCSCRNYLWDSILLCILPYETSPTSCYSPEPLPIPLPLLCRVHRIVERNPGHSCVPHWGAGDAAASVFQAPPSKRSQQESEWRASSPHCEHTQGGWMANSCMSKAKLKWNITITPKKQRLQEYHLYLSRCSNSVHEEPRNNCKADPIHILIITKWMNLPKLCVAKNLLCFNSHLQQFRVISPSQSTCVVCFLSLQMTFEGPSVLVSFFCSNMERKNSNYLSPALTDHSVIGAELGLGLISHSLLSELFLSTTWIWLIPFMTVLTF